jgi:hypothetical protein
MIKPPQCTRIPDVVIVAEARQWFMSAYNLSYRVFYFTIYYLCSGQVDVHDGCEYAFG